ncbi:Hsp70 family protein, partial [Mycoplasma nasistruthionis]
KDVKTNKEQSITITNSSKLSEDEIQRMIKEAELNKEADKKRKEEAETIIRAESLIAQIKKSNAEQGDKLDAKAKEESEKLVAELEQLIADKKIDELKTKLDQVEEVIKNFANASAQANANAKPQSDEEVAEVVEG